MDDDLAVFVPRVGLELYAHPAMAFVGALIVACRHGIGEGEEGGAAATRRAQPLHVEAMLVVEHALQAFTRDVALAAAVNRVADGHVVRGHRLGDCAGRAAHFEEPARDFLPGADLGESAVTERIEVDLERLLIRGQPGAIVCHRSVDSIRHDRRVAITGELGQSVSYRHFASHKSSDPTGGVTLVCPVPTGAPKASTYGRLSRQLPVYSQIMRAILAGGGTGGHVIPALAIAHELQKRYGAEVLFIGTARASRTGWFRRQDLS